MSTVHLLHNIWKKKWQKRISLGRLPPQVIVFKGSQSLTTVKVTKGPCSSLPWSPLHSYTIPIPKSHRLKHKSVTCFHFFSLGSYISTAVKVTGGEYSSRAVRPPNTYNNPLLTATDSPALGLSIGVTSVHWLVSRSNLSTLAKAPSDSLEPPIDKAVNMTCYLLPVRSVQCLEKK